MTPGGHFRWSKITFDRISRYFRSIHNFFKCFHKMAAGGHFGWTKITFSIAFLAISYQYAFLFNFFFQNGRGGHFGSQIWVILDDRKSPLSIAFLAISDQYAIIFLALFFNRVLSLCVINGYAKYEVDRWIYDIIRDATSVLSIFIQNFVLSD